MQVRVRVPGHLKEYVSKEVYEKTGGEAGDFSLVVEGPLSLRELMESIGLRPELAIGALFNGRRVGRDDLVEGDGELIILSPIAGGEGNGQGRDEDAG
ncbi:MAG: ubiquitin family protein [Bacillota bacterium]